MASLDDRDEWSDVYTTDVDVIKEAIKNDDTHRLQELMSTGVDVTRCSLKYGITALHEAAGCGSNKVISALIGWGAPVNVFNVSKWTPLHWAAYKGHTDSVALLVESGAYVNAKHSSNRTPLECALEKGHRDTVEYFIKKAKVDPKLFDKVTQQQIQQLLGDSTESIVASKQETVDGNVLLDFKREVDRKITALEGECQRLSAKCKELEVKYEESIGKSNYLENSIIPNLLERVDALEASVYAIEQLWEISPKELHFCDDTLGSGGWGVLQAAVYKGQKVIAKKMHKEVISQHNQNQLIKQIQTMTKCHHKNLVEFTGAVLEEPVIIVMELMQCTLRSALTKGNILPQHVQSVFLNVAEGLCYLHNIKPQPIIHGDVSPTNVLVKATDNGWIAKLSDFSCTKFAHFVQTSDPGATVYRAPEVTTPPSQETVKVDVYGYGILLVEVLTKEIPHDNTAASLRSLEAKWPDYVAIGRTCISDTPDHRPSMINVHVALSDTGV